MKFSYELLAIAGLAAAQSASRRCGTEPPSPPLAAALADAAQPVPLEAARLQAVTTVDTYVHLIFNGGGITEIPQSQVDEQMRVLNEAYGSFGFAFRTLNITRTTGSWDPATLRQGGYDSLNLYFPTQLPFGILGYCSFPAFLGPDFTPSDIANDGCTNQAGSMPGGTIQDYNLGLTAVHEVGHWLGLFHVFNRNCDGPGDFVDDTAPQANSTEGCPAVAPDTCPLRPGRDNIHNYMDYSTDVCLTEFTPGQIERGTNIFNELRAGAQRFSPSEQLPGGAIVAPNRNRNCKGENTYMGVRKFRDGQYDVARCQQHCQETNRFNARHGRPNRCRFFNTFMETIGSSSVQNCALYTQKWDSRFATNSGQVRPSTGRVTISRSVSSFDLENDGVPSDC